MNKKNVTVIQVDQKLSNVKIIINTSDNAIQKMYEKRFNPVFYFTILPLLQHLFLVYKIKFNK